MKIPCGLHEVGIRKFQCGRADLDDAHVRPRVWSCCRDLGKGIAYRLGRSFTCVQLARRRENKGGGGRTRDPRVAVDQDRSVRRHATKGRDRCVDVVRLRGCHIGRGALDVMEIEWADACAHLAQAHLRDGPSFRVGDRDEETSPKPAGNIARLVERTDEDGPGSAGVEEVKHVRPSGLRCGELSPVSLRCSRQSAAHTRKRGMCPDFRRRR